MKKILVNERQWNSVSPEDQNAIKKGLVESGAIDANDEFVADPDAPEIDPKHIADPSWNPIKDICKAGCNAAAAAAAAWCVANTSGVATAVCLAAAESARKHCCDRC